MVNVREASAEDRCDWLRMRGALWPGSLADHDADTRRFFDEPDERMRVFVAEDAQGTLVGFLELDQRKYAPGCTSSPVPFIEGWFVEASARQQGVGRALVRAAERWARAAGFHEIASDAEIHNEISHAAHGAVGYEEVERIASFRRSLDDV
jgi:aminoglycoside 6'-N-acetyltransferase I